jgi:nucleosome binding factor SPN SPT16 subunit
MIDKLPKPNNYNGPEVEFILRDIKATTSNEEIITNILKNNSRNVTHLTEEKGIGKLVDEFFAVFSKLNKVSVEAANFVDSIFFTKDSDEIDCIKVSSKYCSYIANCMIKKVEKAIDDDKQVTNVSISSTIEEYTKKEAFVNKFKESSKLQAINSAHLEAPDKLIVQSGSNFDWNFGVSSTKDNLNASVIVCKSQAKYKDYYSKVIRTYMIDSDTRQLTNYKLLLEAYEHLTTILLRPGVKLSEVYTKTVSFLKEKNPALSDKLHDIFGYGIGIEYSNKSLIINEDSRQRVSANMVFLVNLSLKNLKNDKGVSYWIQIADTVLVGENGNQILTDDVKKGASDIYYNMEEDEEASEDKVSTNDKGNKMEIDEDIVKINDRDAPMTRNYYRQKKTEKVGGQSDAVKRKAHQLQLLEKKNQQLKERLENGDFGGDQQKSMKIIAEKIKTYDKSSNVPTEFKKGKLCVDLKNDCLIAPMFKSMVPFHGSLIKSVTKSVDGIYEYIRINFHTPLSGNSSISFSELANSKDLLYIRDLTFRSPDRKHFDVIYKQLNELIKKVKNKEKEDKEKSNLIEQESLQMNKSGKRVYMESVSLRPSFNGKTKTIGVLEAHNNGFRFLSNKGDKVDIIYKNIRHSFYQPCEKELIVILHFTLKNPILIGKKKRWDIQFVREVGTQSDDMKFKSRSEFDEYEQELKDIKYKERINSEFLKFTERIESMCPQIEFDIPYRELAFEGAPAKTSVWLMPTVNALVSLVELPYFVCSLEDIELVFFERVSQAIKNFDMAIVFKDFNKQVHRISSIPSSYLEILKNWLDSVDILFSEGNAPINWSVMMMKMKKDPDEFIESGCWNVLHHDVEDSDDEESEVEGDPSFELEEEEEDDESEYEDEESEEDDEDDDDSSFEEEDLTEEGVSWDELEKQAIKTDNQRKFVDPNPPKKNNNKKRKN